jgi:hypothetical protein
MTQVLYAHMNNNNKKRTFLKKTTHTHTHMHMLTLLLQVSFLALKLLHVLCLNLREGEKHFNEGSQRNKAQTRECHVWCF